MNNLAPSSSVAETVTVTLRHPLKESPPPGNTIGSVTSSSVRPKLKVVTSNQLPAPDEQEVVRLLTRSSTSPGYWLKNSGDLQASPKPSIFANDSAPTLPNRAPDAAGTTATTPMAIRRAKSNVFRAAEPGREDILPMTNGVIAAKSPLRSRALSSSSFSSKTYAGFSSGPPTTEQHQILRSPAKSLRSRHRSSARRERPTMNSDTASSNDDHSVEFSMFDPKNEEQSSPKAPVYADDEVDNDGEESIGANKKLTKPHPPNVKDFLVRVGKNNDNTLLNMNTPQFITLILLLFITCFVAGSYRQVIAATSQIEQVRLGESTLMVHLHKIEQQALQLAENLQHLSERSDGALPPSEEEKNTAELDSDLLRAQVEQLRGMEAELDHEVKSLRKAIQMSAKQEMIKEFGQGAVQVLFEIETLDWDGAPDNSDRRNTISIRLWYDTPHAVWTFLQQVKEGVWDGASFSIQQGRSVLAEPETTGGRQQLQPGLDFMEPSERGHERYTVTLTDMNLAINLQDNKKIYKLESSVGVIFEGFDVLHNIVKDSASSKTVRIKKARASHMTRAETAGLI